MADHKILTVSELADHLNIHRITVYRLLKSGVLPGFKIGRVWRFDREEITSWIKTGKAPETQAETPAPAPASKVAASPKAPNRNLRRARI